MRALPVAFLGPRALLALLMLGTALSGCISDDTSDNDGQGAPPVVDETARLLDEVVFSKLKLLDTLRAGGEPVIAITKEGTLLVSAHPGWTHYHPSEDPTHPGVELVQPANGQSYLWRSTDNGETWAHIGLAGTEYGPRGTGPGVSDPEFTVMMDGTICFTDLEGLAMSSVSCSTDDGVTWIGNPIASQRPNDRQWLASYQDELYFTANYFTDHNVIVSTDHGLTWATRGNVPCSGDIIADPADGTIYAGCGNGVTVSEDGGRTWETREVPDSSARGRGMTEPALDSAGNVWMVWADNEERLFVAGSPDKGETWPWQHGLTDDFIAFANTTTGVAGNGTFVWPWISAGSEGRLAVTWIGSYDAGRSSEMDSDWFMFSAFLVGAHDLANGTAVRLYQASDVPIHHGPICQSGTGCQVTSMQGDDAGDRRLGDFFETTIDRQGRLHIVVSDTLAQKDDVVSHVAYMRQDAGFPLYVEGDREPTQG